jgi:hypothetical protein
MITVQIEMCGFGIKRRWEFGDPRRAPITVLEMGFIKVCKMRGDSKLVEFMRVMQTTKNSTGIPKFALHVEKQNVKPIRTMTTTTNSRLENFSIAKM